MAVFVINRSSGKNLKAILKTLTDFFPKQKLHVKLDIFGGNDAVQSKLSGPEISFNVSEGDLVEPTVEKINDLFNELDNENFVMPRAQFKELVMYPEGATIKLTAYELEIKFSESRHLLFVRQILELTKDIDDIEINILKQRAL